MLKEYDEDEGYRTTYSRAFSGFPKNVGFNNCLPAPQPAFIQGLGAEEFRPFPVANHLDAAVLYKDDRHSVTLPHIAGECRGPDANIAKATLRSAYDGAALVYARNQALLLIGKPDPPGHASVTTVTTDGTALNFFAHYAATSKVDGTMEYHQYQYASANVRGTYQGHKDGRRGFRNEQDRARDQAYALRDQLNEHWEQRHRSNLHPIAARAPLPATNGTFEETNGDEAGYKYEMVVQPCQSTPAASSSPHKPSSSVSSPKSLPYNE